MRPLSPFFHPIDCISQSVSGFLYLSNWACRPSVNGAHQYFNHRFECVLVPLGPTTNIIRVNLYAALGWHKVRRNLSPAHPIYSSIWHHLEPMSTYILLSKTTNSPLHIGAIVNTPPPNFPPSVISNVMNFRSRMTEMYTSCALYKDQRVCVCTFVGV